MDDTASVGIDEAGGLNDVYVYMTSRYNDMYQSVTDTDWSNVGLLLLFVPDRCVVCVAV